MEFLDRARLHVITSSTGSQNGKKILLYVDLFENWCKSMIFGPQISILFFVSQRESFTSSGVLCRQGFKFLSPVICSHYNLRVEGHTFTGTPCLPVPPAHNPIPLPAGLPLPPPPLPPWNASCNSSQTPRCPPTRTTPWCSAVCSWRSSTMMTSTTARGFGTIIMPYPCGICGILKPSRSAGIYLFMKNKSYVVLFLKFMYENWNVELRPNINPANLCHNSQYTLELAFFAIKLQKIFSVCVI